MGMRAWLRDRFTEPITFSAEPRPIDRVIMDFANRGGPGVTIGRQEALSVPAMLRARNMLCVPATLPLVQYGPDRRITPHPLLQQFDRDVPNVVHLAQTFEDLLFDAIAWWEVLEQDSRGYPTWVRRRDPSTCSLQPPAGYTPAPLPSGWDPREAVVYVDGRPVPGSRMIRFDSPNPGIGQYQGRALRRAVLLDVAAQMYAEDPKPLGFFTPAEGADPADDTAVAAMITGWLEARRRRSTGYVPAAVKYNEPMGAKPADLQLVELQKQVTLEIANATGIDPEDLGISTTSRTYQNDTNRRQDRINDTHSPYMAAITDRLKMPDVTRRGHLVRFDLDDYLRADPKTRFEVYEIGQRLGVYDLEYILAEEMLPPRPAGAAPIAAPAVPAAGVPDNVTPLRPPAAPAAIAAGGRASVTFDAGPGHPIADVPVIGFGADRARRTISGRALPYNAISTRKGFTRYRFAPGALRWSDPRRIKLLRDHNYSLPLGHAVSITDGPDGLDVVFAVAPGPDGDQALALAEHGTLDGLSVGVDFEAQHTMPDPLNAGVTLVLEGQLLEVSLLAMPSFDDARLTHVAASREDTAMTHQAPAAAPAQAGTNGHAQYAAPQYPQQFAQPQPPAPQPQPTPQPTPQPQPPAAAGAQLVTFSLEQLQALMAAGGQLPNATGLQAPAADDGGRQFVNPAGNGTPAGGAQVAYAAPYSFDRRGELTAGPEHDFSRDLIAGSKGDGAALERATTFIREVFDVDRADVGALNPNRQRPDLYVDQRQFRTPLWDAIRKGSLQDSTPFVLPKFNSASGLVAAHTEGVEPTPGAMTATSQTITPTASSGKVEITREAWDQGGNPQLSGLIWRQMLRSWAEALEAKAVAVLDAATPTGITFTAGGGTSGQTLVREVRREFAKLQFARGGFSMDNLFAQIDLYLALIGAESDDGRPIFPALGPSNTDGTVRSRYGALDVNGVTANPAWALAATGSVAASSYLFDSESVCGWATNPQRLEFQYRVAYVDLAIWGYTATGIIDINGVRELIFDPVA
ncbi:MAG TPA: phage portal protein [Pseudonocardia sp.]|nr:phage portal protein [Pseudonocardia sp.]